MNKLSKKIGSLKFIVKPRGHYYEGYCLDCDNDGGCAVCSCHCAGVCRQVFGRLGDHPYCYQVTCMLKP